MALRRRFRIPRRRGARRQGRQTPLPPGRRAGEARREDSPAAPRERPALPSRQPPYAAADPAPDAAGDGPGRWSSGWIAPTSRRSPSTSRGPGRVTTMSSIPTIALFFTAVIADQPDRFATASGVTPYAESPRMISCGSAVTSFSVGISQLVELPVVIGVP